MDNANGRDTRCEAEGVIKHRRGCQIGGPFLRGFMKGVSEPSNWEKGGIEMVTVNGEARSIAGLTLQDYLKTTSYDLTRD